MQSGTGARDGDPRGRTTDGSGGGGRCVGRLAKGEPAKSAICLPIDSSTSETQKLCKLRRCRRLTGPRENRSVCGIVAILVSTRGGIVANVLSLSLSQFFRLCSFYPHFRSTHGTELRAESGRNFARQAHIEYFASDTRVEVATLLIDQRDRDNRTMRERKKERISFPFTFSRATFEQRNRVQWVRCSWKEQSLPAAGLVSG